MKDIINKKTQENLNYLRSHFTPEYIELMTDKKEYVVGFGSRNKSFCYLVEAGTKDIGEIRGATSSKFGLWFGTYGDDKEPKYRATKKNFGGDVEKAFEDIKVALAKLIREAQNMHEFRDVKSLFSNMFKYKIIYLYNPEIMLPSFLLEDMNRFEDHLGLKISDTFEKAQKSLLEYKRVNCPDQTNFAFMCNLYMEYGKNDVSNTKEINEEADNKLNKDILKEKDPIEEYVTKPVEKAQLKKTNEGSYYYPRDSKMAAISLKNANHRCENDINHDCFIRKSVNVPYTEVHHLIPLAYHYKFKKSLDIPENIVSLCSNCHNLIHYGRDADELITKLFNERKEKLRQAGIDITLEQLLEMYHKIGEHK